MDQKTRKLLLRWRSLLEDERTLKAVQSRSRVFNVIGLRCCCFVVFGVIFGLNRIAIAVAAAVAGSMAAEMNALRMRLTQWPIFKQYIIGNGSTMTLAPTNRSPCVSVSPSATCSGRRSWWRWLSGGGWIDTRQHRGEAPRPS